MDSCGADSAPVTSPSVSVVIPTRNRLPLLKEAVGSVVSQSFIGWEAIVVDDRSTDSTWNWLSEVNDPRLRTIRLDGHSERSTARNRGLQEARGEFILFLDDDDRLTPNALQYLMGWFVRQPDVMAVVGARRDFDERGHRRRCSHPRIPVKKVMRDEAVLGWYPQFAQCAIRSKTIRDLRGWDPTLIVAEDYALWLSLTEVGPALLVPRVVLEYRTHGGQWRPSDALSVEDELRVGILNDAAPKERSRNARLIDAHVLHGLACAQQRQGNYRPATFNYLRTIQTAPQVLCSPVTGPALAGNLSKAIVGTVLHRGLIRSAKQAKATTRDWLHRDPGAAWEPQIRSVSGKHSGGG